MASKNKTYTIATLAANFNHSKCYVRRAISQGKLETERVPLENGGFKHVITEESYQNWRESVGARSNREDGRTKYVLYATSAEYDQLMNLVAEAKSEVIVARANPPKSDSN